MNLRYKHNKYLAWPGADEFRVPDTLQIILNTEKYLKDLKDHFIAVQEAYATFLVCCREFPVLTVEKPAKDLERCIKAHGCSSLTPEEFFPMRNHLYPIDGSSPDYTLMENFYIANDIHARRNDRHPRGNVCEANVPQNQVYVDPMVFCAHMVIDWMATHGTGMVEWYKENKDAQSLTPNEIGHVEAYMTAITGEEFNA